MPKVNRVSTPPRGVLVVKPDGEWVWLRDGNRDDGWRELGASMRRSGLIASHCVPMFVAHLLLEHDRSLRGIYNCAPGNRKLTHSEEQADVEYYSLVDDFESNDKYRAYRTLDDGMVNYNREVARRWDLVQAASLGDPEMFAEALLTTGYVGPGYPPFARFYPSRDAQLWDLRTSMRELYTEVIAAGV